MEARSPSPIERPFQREVTVTDPVDSFFGRDAQQGLALFDLMSRRYDVVAANPPYMAQRIWELS